MIANANSQRRVPSWGDRRQMPRGGRRAADEPGSYPTLVVAVSCAEVERACSGYLKHFGFDVENASNAGEAMTLVRWLRPRAVISDIPLPDVAPIPVLHFVDTPDGWLASAQAPPGEARFDAMLSEIRRVLRAQTVAPPV
jgi:hypothetical protein